MCFLNRKCYVPRFDKISERALNTGLLVFLSFSKCFKKGQFGFRSGCNTTGAVSEVMNL